MAWTDPGQFHLEVPALDLKLEYGHDRFTAPLTTFC